MAQAKAAMEKVAAKAEAKAKSEFCLPPNRHLGLKQENGHPKGRPFFWAIRFWFLSQLDQSVALFTGT
jgi:hypothetical protein